MFAMSHDRNTIVKNERVSAEECEEMIKWKTCKHGKLSVRNGILETNNPVLAKDPSWTQCCKTYTFKTSNCFVLPAKFYKAHQVHHMTCTAADVDHCGYQKGKCQLKNGNFAIWKPSKKEICQYIPYTIISGTATNTHFLNDDQTISITFSNQTFSECGNTGLQMSLQGIVFRFLSNNHNTTRSPRRRRQNRRMQNRKSDS